MGLLENTSQKDYYEGSSFGNYQFTSLEDIIDYFMAVYIGEDKLIPKARRMDVSFHAQRAMQELSFDTFKSVKSHQIELPPTLKMMLPHDYVNYTKISSVDSSGVKHLLYPTKHTNNPFEIKQNSDGTYFFGEEHNIVINNDFDNDLSGNWSISTPALSSAWNNFTVNSGSGIYNVAYIQDTIEVSNEQLVFSHLWNNAYGIQGESRAYAAWQALDVTNIDYLELAATATSGAQQSSGPTLICDFGVVRVGITTTDPTVGWPTARIPSGGSVATGFKNAATSVISNANNSAPANTIASFPSPNTNPDNFELGYVEWSDGTTSQKTIDSINVSAYNQVWVYIQSFSPWTPSAITSLTAGAFKGGTTQPLPNNSANNTPQQNKVDSVSVIVPGNIQTISNNTTDNTSSTWTSYKSHTPSENNVNDYQDYENDIYWPNEGKRYGLEPSHAQVNGSFYIDERIGNIHFSSNISGKTVILDYISDSLGTDAEMQVHKFAEEAMYKYLMHAIISTSSYGQNLVPRLTKEKFAAIRKAKLRLSNLKLKELTQILRGKSKQIKH